MEQQKSNKTLILIIVAIVIFLLIIGLVIYFVYFLTKRSFENLSQPTSPPVQKVESPTPALSESITNTFITTVISETGEPEDIGLASFAFDMEPLTVVAELSTNAPAQNFEAKWFYLGATPGINFYSQQPTQSPSGKYLTTSLHFAQLAGDIINYQPMSNTFPLGEYRLDWYADSQKITSTTFTVLGQ